jgi:hypothetical protein
VPGGSPGSELLVSLGPTLLVDIGFDASYNPSLLRILSRPRYSRNAGNRGHRSCRILHRPFLRNFTMIYEGRTGTVILSSD